MAPRLRGTGLLDGYGDLYTLVDPRPSCHSCCTSWLLPSAGLLKEDLSNSELLSRPTDSLIYSPISLIQIQMSLCENSIPADPIAAGNSNADLQIEASDSKSAGLAVFCSSAMAWPSSGVRRMWRRPRVSPDFMAFRGSAQLLDLSVCLCVCVCAGVCVCVCVCVCLFVSCLRRLTVYSV